MRHATKTSRLGLSQTGESRIWYGMLQRCFNPNDRAYEWYGARGITVCDRWRVFANFYADMGQRPSPKHGIDRIDNDGNYEPGNCRWATSKENNNNRRSNRLIEFRGETKNLKQWSEEYGLGADTVAYRIDRYGWSVERALTTPSGATVVKQLTYAGETKTTAEWAVALGLPYQILDSRLRDGWSVEAALTTPPRANCRRKPRPAQSIRKFRQPLAAV